MWYGGEHSRSWYYSVPRVAMAATGRDLPELAELSIGVPATESPRSRSRSPLCTLYAHHPSSCADLGRANRRRVLRFSSLVGRPIRASGGICPPPRHPTYPPPCTERASPCYDTHSRLRWTSSCGTAYFIPARSRRLYAYRADQMASPRTRVGCPWYRPRDAACGLAPVPGQQSRSWWTIPPPS